ncbi:MAG: hypothetical protein IJ309_01960 [Clostridia bacterium]|nr:hypothetical protein [Clostridia bacterium]
MKAAIIKASISLAVVLLVVSVLFATGGSFTPKASINPNETFTGAISKESYPTTEASAMAYVEKELNGKTVVSTFNSYTKISDLSEEEISSKNLSQFTSASIVSAELGMVDYNYNEKNAQSELYILNTSSGYFYFTYIQKVGEQMTNSYFEELTDGSKYVDCTSTTTLGLTVIKDGMPVESSYLQTIKYDNTLAHFRQDYPGMFVDAFIEEQDGANLKSYASVKGGYYDLAQVDRELRKHNMYLMGGGLMILKGNDRIEISSLNSMTQVTDFIFAIPADASFFIKTGEGRFSMPEEKYKDVCRAMLGESAYAQFNQAWEQYNVHFSSEYVVDGDRLAYSIINLQMSNGTDTFILSVETHYTDFDTTEVTLPEVEIFDFEEDYDDLFGGL